MATILVVDDQPVNRSFLTTLLGYRGYRLLEASGGREALEAARAEHPDLVITDILMPTMDGFEFVRQLRLEPPTAAVPVIFYTAAYQRWESYPLAEAAGGVHHLDKPADPEVILRAVDEALGSARSWAPIPPVEEFDREHLRLLTDKLARKVDELEREVAERRQVEEELRAAKEAAELANRAKDRFLAVLSHELRTPLTPVLLAVSAALDGSPPVAAELRPLMEMIRDNVGLERRLIDDLFDLTRIARGQLALDLQRVEVHAVIGRACEVCRAEADKAGLNLVLDLAATEHHARADATRLQQVFWNLIQNAIKFTPAGGTVTIRSRTVDSLPGRGLIVEVADTGIGIEAEVLPRLFQPFAQGETAPYRRHHMGLGLGLAIARSIAEAHGGRLTAASSGPGHGATFTLELAPDLTQSPAITSPPPQPPNGKVPSRALRILLVEDNKHILDCLTWILGQRRHTVTAAASMASARQLAATDDFDLIISDIELGDGTGLELMRELSVTRAIPGIAISGFGSDFDRRMSREAGFAEHLIKPIEVRTLEQAIARVFPAMRASRPSEDPGVAAPERPAHLRGHSFIPGAGRP